MDAKHINASHRSLFLDGGSLSALFDGEAPPESPVKSERKRDAVSGCGFADTPPCPACGASMKPYGRGATARKHGPRFVCPVDIARNDTWHRNAEGHWQRADDGKHSVFGPTFWTPGMIEAANMPALAPDDNDLPF